MKREMFLLLASGFVTSFLLLALLLFSSYLAAMLFLRKNHRTQFLFMQCPEGLLNALVFNARTMERGSGLCATLCLSIDFIFILIKLGTGKKMDSIPMLKGMNVESLVSLGWGWWTLLITAGLFLLQAYLTNEWVLSKSRASTSSLDSHTTYLSVDDNDGYYHDSRLTPRPVEVVAARWCSCRTENRTV